jgi:hypothetical protein
LEQIKELIEKKSELQETMRSCPAEYDMRQLIDIIRELSNLTNDYYEIIPTNSYTHNNIPPIENIARYRDAKLLVRKLLEVEQPIKMLLGARATMPAVNPLDYCMRALGIKILNLDKRDKEYNAIFEYINNSSPQEKNNVDIYAVEQNSINGRFKKNLKNRMLLWHGSKTENFLGILREGLKIAPIEAEKSGDRFGSGLYFTDCFTKAFLMCRGFVSSSFQTVVQTDHKKSKFRHLQKGADSPQVSHRFVILSEVALGEQKLTNQDNAAGCIEHEGMKPTFDDENIKIIDTDGKEYESLLVCGGSIPDPRKDIWLDNGMIMPLGR